MQNLHFISTSTFYKDVLENIYTYTKDIICDFFYLEEMKFRTFIYNHIENKNVGKVIVPGELELDFTYNGKNIHIKHEYIYDKDNKIDKIMLMNDNGGTKGQALFTKLTLSSIDKKLLIDFVDESRKIVEKRRKTNRDKNNDTLRVYYWKEYWALFSKIPKRPIDTLYLNPQQDITFFGGTNDISVGVFIDISFDGNHWFDSNFPVVKNTSADFSVNYHTQARYIRLRFNNTSASTKIIEKSYAAYKFNKYKDKSGVITSLDANISYVTS